MLDWNRIRELRNEVGDDEFKLILDMSLDEVESVLMRLSRRHGARLTTDLHFLKGCAWNLGFRGFGVLCDDGERLAAEGRSAELDRDGILDCYAQSKQLLIHALQAEAQSAVQQAKRA